MRLAEKFNINLLEPYQIFLVVGLIWGTVFLFVTPPFQSPDEFNHFFRAFQVSEGTLISKKLDNKVGGFLPRSLNTTMVAYNNFPGHSEIKQKKKNIDDVLELPINPGDKFFAEFPNTALYSPVPYWPQSLGINLGKFHQVSPLMLTYLGRMSNLIVWLILVAVALKITPIFKWLFLLLALTPMSLFQAASLSADCFTNALAFLTISLFLQYAYDRAKTVKFTDLCLLFAATLLLTLSKNVYFLFPVLFLLIPIHKIGSVKKYYFTFFLLSLFNGAALTGWFLVARHLYIPVKPEIFPDRQLIFILSHFFRYLMTMGNSFWILRDIVVNSCIGLLGWWDTPMPDIYYFLTKTVLIFFAIFETNKLVELPARNKLVLLLCLLGTIFVISTVVYMTWDSVGYEVFDGLQGRYFIPVAPLLFLLFNNRKSSLSGKYLSIIGSIYLSVSLFWTLLVLIKRYY